MSRRLLKQMANEWRSNLWLLVELLVVSVVLWYVADYLWMQIRNYTTPLGLVTERVYAVDDGTVSPLAPEYDASDSTYSTRNEHRMKIYERLRRDPAVETVALAYMGVPNELSNYGSGLYNPDPNDSLRMIGGVSMRFVSPEYVEMFEVSGINGETPGQLAAMLREGKILLTENIPYDLTPHKYYKDWQEFYDVTGANDPRILIGRTFLMSDSSEVVVGAMVRPIKRVAYEIASNVALMPLETEFMGGTRILVKAKPEAVEGFEEHILSNPAYASGNRYISGVVKVDSIGLDHRTEQLREIRNYVIIMVFLLVTVFLGLLGTFWFRTQQRVGEIAIRMVNGATRRNIFRRLIGEGILLLTVATVPAIGLDWLVTYFQLNHGEGNMVFFNLLNFTECVVAVYLLMSLMIVAGIWFPASKAMRINPAEAVKDE